MTNNENRYNDICNIIDEYETEPPQYPCWSLYNGSEYEQFKIGNEEELKEKINEYLDTSIEEFYNEGYEELTLYYEVGSHWNDLTEVKTIISEEEVEEEKMRQWHIKRHREIVDASPNLLLRY